MRLEWFRYTVGLRPLVTSQPLRMGDAFHRGLDSLYSGNTQQEAVQVAMSGYGEWPAWARTEEERLEWSAEGADVSNLLCGYSWFWGQDNIASNLSVAQVIASELSFSLPFEKATGRKKPGWRFAGKIDKIVRLGDGRLAVMEHKTTADSIAPDSDYWEPLNNDAQISLYFEAAKHLGYDVQTVLYDVARKPRMSPLLATPLEKRKYKADGTLYANQRAENETVEAYQKRVWDDIVADPASYYARMEIPRTRADQADFRDDLYGIASLIAAATKNGWHPRNTKQCRNQRRCEFMSCCTSFRQTGEVPAGFEIVENRHPELGV